MAKDGMSIIMKKYKYESPSIISDRRLIIVVKRKTLIKI